MYENDRYKRANDGEYNNLLFVAIVGILIFILVRGWEKSKQQAYLNVAGTDKDTQLAQALRDAFNVSGINWAMGADGTDTQLVFSTAQQITDYAAVSTAYRVLYGSELTNDLQSELSRTDLQKFYDIVNAKTGTGTTTGTTGTVVKSSVGKTVTAIMTTNIRADRSPYAVESNFIGGNMQAKAGETLGEYDSEKVIPNVPYSGNKNTFVRYKTFSVFGLVTEYHWVVKSAVKIT